MRRWRRCSQARVVRQGLPRLGRRGWKLFPRRPQVCVLRGEVSARRCSRDRARCRFNVAVVVGIDGGIDRNVRGLRSHGSTGSLSRCSAGRWFNVAVVVIDGRIGRNVGGRSPGSTRSLLRCGAGRGFNFGRRNPGRSGMSSDRRMRNFETAMRRGGAVDEVRDRSRAGRETDLAADVVNPSRTPDQTRSTISIRIKINGMRGWRGPCDYGVCVSGVVVRRGLLTPREGLGICPQGDKTQQSDEGDD